jgi:hypothetical protein
VAAQLRIAYEGIGELQRDGFRIIVIEADDRGGAELAECAVRDVNFAGNGRTLTSRRTSRRSCWRS